MIADHLNQSECRELSEALKMKHFRLEHPLTGDGEPDVPCIELLRHWDRHEGKHKTFQDLALRLTEMNRKDLADKLSNTVYKEKSDAVKRLFLDDPFKKIIHTNSPLLVEASTKMQMTSLPEPTSDDWSTLETVSVICLFISCICIYGMIFKHFVLKYHDCSFVQSKYTKLREHFYASTVGIKAPEDENVFVVL